MSMVKFIACLLDELGFLYRMGSVSLFYAFSIAMLQNEKNERAKSLNEKNWKRRP